MHIDKVKTIFGVIYEAGGGGAWLASGKLAVLPVILAYTRLRYIQLLTIYASNKWLSLQTFHKVDSSEMKEFRDFSHFRDCWYSVVNVHKNITILYIIHV